MQNLMGVISAVVGLLWLGASPWTPRVVGAEKETPSPDGETLSLADIRIRDPFVFTDAKNGRYLMVASKANRDSKARGWECYTSKDLQHWAKPVSVFTPPAGFWADHDFWAPEIHAYHNKYYLFGTLSADRVNRGTQIFEAENPLGPYRPHSAGAATPHDWMALDGTLYVENNQPWMVFCHEWVQIGDGAMDAVRLSPDLSKPIGDPIVLFHASEAPWGRPNEPGKYVTDGPCLYRMKSGPLVLLWSSFGARGYTVGMAYSKSGSIQGPWAFDNRKPIYEGGGHGMIFRSLEGKPMFVLHGPNDATKERARFFQVEETLDSNGVSQTLRLTPVAWQNKP
jgi:beta-xylosidase